MPYDRVGDVAMEGYNAGPKTVLRTSFPLSTQ